jgi:hypothetical protein
MPKQIKKTSYSNAPSPKLIEKIGATNLTLADAIAEIVANSFDSADDDQKTVVNVTVNPDQIMVVDNSVGMTENVLVDAVKLGMDMATVVKKNERSKGKFGLGMKTACASMGRWWAIHTRPIGENIEYRVEFDLAEWEKRPDSEDAWTIEIEAVEPDLGGPLAERPHGTAIMVKKLRSREQLAGSIRKKLGDSFKPHLEQGAKIYIGTELAVPTRYEFVQGSKVPIDIKFGQDDEYKITGWVALDSQTHNDGQYGFNIYRRDQLVQRWNQDWFAGHLMTSRIIGEVHMDFIDATFFKQGLQQSELWRLASEQMKIFMKPIVAASRDLSRKGNINVPQKRAEIIRNLYSSLGMDPAAAPTAENVTENGGDSGAKGTPPETRSELVKLQIEADELVLESGTKILISRIERSMTADGAPFDYIPDGDPVDLQTVINTDHPLFLNTKDKDQLRSLGVADSILRYLVDKEGMSSKAAVQVRNEWLLKSKPKVKEASNE